MTSTTKTTRLSLDVGLEAGLEKNKGTLPPLLVMGKMRATDECITVMQGRIAAANAVAPAKANWQGKAKAAAQEIADTKQFVSELSQQLVFYYGSTLPETLADFDLKPRKPRNPPSTVTKVVAVQKRARTRIERGTKSKKAAQAIKSPPLETVNITVKSSKVQSTEAGQPAPGPQAAAGPLASSGNGGGGATGKPPTP